MTDELWREQLKRYAEATSKELRKIGIEMTPDEAESVVTESLREAIKEFWVRRWLRLMEEQ